jgi:hypothetical protein
MGYADGTQADHDRAFGESGSQPDDDVVRLDCGCYDTEDRSEPIGDKRVCHKCHDAAVDKVKAILLEHADPRPQYDGVTAYEIATMIIEHGVTATGVAFQIDKWTEPHGDADVVTLIMGVL